MSRSICLKLLALAIVLGLSLPKTSTAGAARIPQPDTTGSLEGTWYYTDPGFQIAIFISPDETGVLKVHYHVLNRTTEAEYQTDDAGTARYIEDGSPVDVVFRAEIESLHRMKGYHERTVKSKTTTYRESGEFDLYLAEKGQKLVLHYPTLKGSKTAEDGRTTTNRRKDVVRLFRKASDMVVDFSEIPF